MKAQSDRQVQHSATQASYVFLGGSCNPTTWRKDTAIPALDVAGISYYNPQVEDWSPELIDLGVQIYDTVQDVITDIIADYTPLSDGAR